MTSDDMRSLVELAEDVFPINARKTKDSLETKVGNSERNRRYQIDAVVFLQLMERLGGTFVWTDGPKEGDRFANVFEALSTQMPQFADMSFNERYEHVQEYGPKLRSGFYAARKWLLSWYEDTVYLVPQQKESSIPTVITLDPSYELKSGKTASQMQTERDYKLADGQVIASAKRLAASTKNKSDVHSKLDRIMEHARLELQNMKPGRLLADE